MCQRRVHHHASPQQVGPPLVSPAGFPASHRRARGLDPQPGPNAVGHGARTCSAEVSSLRLPSSVHALNGGSWRLILEDPPPRPISTLLARAGWRGALASPSMRDQLPASRKRELLRTQSSSRSAGTPGSSAEVY